MKAIVVYESLWGNTAGIAGAIASGIGSGTPALNTSEATGEALEGVDLIVAGAPVLAFSLPTEKIRESINANPGKAPKLPDLSSPSMRSWMSRLSKGNGLSAAFETRIWWSPGGSIGPIARSLAGLGYRPVGKGHRFIVKGSYGPLREGELERARLWGAELARLLSQAG